MAKKPTAKDDLKLLFERPREPLFTTKSNGKVAFDVPEDYYTDRYKPIGISLSNRLGEDVERIVHLRSVATKPNLDFAKSLKVRGPFSLFNPKHQEIAGQLTTILLDAPDVDTLLSIAAYVKDRVNPYLFQVSMGIPSTDCGIICTNFLIAVFVGGGNAKPCGHPRHHPAVDSSTVSRSIRRLFGVSAGT